MNSNDNIFLNLLSAYINKKEISLNDPKNIDWDYIYKLATIHNVVGIIYAVVNRNKINIPKELNEKMQKAFFATTIYSIKQEEEAKKLIDILNENRIWHLVSKGYVIRDYYPDKELRTMGDIDILVTKKSLNTVRELLSKNGYKKGHEIGSESVFIKNDVVFEIHTSLMDESLGGVFDYDKYYNKILKRESKRLITNYTYTLMPEEHFVYLIVHLAKHFFNDGAGIRMFMDIFLFGKINFTKINWNKVKRILYDMQLGKFANNIWYICLKWFAAEERNEIYKVWKPMLMSENLYKQVESYVLRGGVFGFDGHDKNQKMFRQPEVIKEDDDINKKWRFILKWVFPNYEKIQKHYKWFKNKPIILIPLGWGIRIISKIFINPKDFFNKIKFLFKKNTAKEEYEMLKNMGLYNKGEMYYGSTKRGEKSKR